MNRRDALKIMAVVPIVPVAIIGIMGQEEDRPNCADKIQPETHEIECRWIPPVILEPTTLVETPGMFEVVATYRESQEGDGNIWVEHAYTWRMNFDHSKLLEVQSCAAWLEFPENLVEWCENLTFGPHLSPGILNHATAEEWPHEDKTEKNPWGLPVCVLCNGKIRLKLSSFSVTRFDWGVDGEGIIKMIGRKEYEPHRKMASVD